MRITDYENNEMVGRHKIPNLSAVYIALAEIVSIVCTKNKVLATGKKEGSVPPLMQEFFFPTHINAVLKRREFFHLKLPGNRKRYDLLT